MSSSSNEVLRSATAQALEFPGFLATLAQLTSSDLGRRRVLQLEPLSRRTEIDERQGLIAEARKALETAALVPYLEEPVLPLVERLGDNNSAVTGSDLLRLAASIEIVREAEQRLSGTIPEDSALLDLFQPDAELLELCQEIQRSLDRRGGVRDSASSELVRLRRRIRSVREGLYASLQQTLERHKDNFAETTVTLKDGRLNLLLSSGAKGRTQGLIHGRSGTGQSFYFEPLEAVEGNNSLQEAIEAEAEERQRILNDLIDRAREQLESIERQLDVLAELDLIQAISRYAERGRCVLPTISERSEIQLIEARHPLLDPEFAELREAALGTSGHTEPVVPLNIELDAVDRILVITGPNAGGKTVALKTTGLLALIAQCGLPIPAQEGSRVSIFESIMAMVGDEQDLLTDRSTFSARLLRLKQAWELAGPKSLILLDELGSGTDPEEGAALAIALLEGLLESKSLGVLTTHLTQLSAVALEYDGALCAAMEFDPDSGRPTYRLRPGAPGASEAISLAERLGLPSTWLARAEELLGGEHRNLRRLLQEVEEVRHQLAETQSDVESRARLLEMERAEVAAELESLELERKSQRQKIRAEFDDFRRRVTDQLRDELEAMLGKVEQGRKRGLVAESANRLFEDAPQIEEEEPTGSVLVGAQVRHRSLRWEGRLEKVKGTKAEVRVKGKKVRCEITDLAPASETERVKTKARRRGVEIRLGDGESELPVELNLLGLRVEPALDELDRYLDQALMGDRNEVRIVHGFGSGRLREAVRSHLDPHPAVARFRPGKRDEGGDGATVVVLDKN